MAAKQNIRLHEGIYVMSGGPQYESPAEVCLFKVVGADALGRFSARILGALTEMTKHNRKLFRKSA